MNKKLVTVEFDATIIQAVDECRFQKRIGTTVLSRNEALRQLVAFALTQNPPLTPGPRSAPSVQPKNQ